MYVSIVKFKPRICYCYNEGPLLTLSVFVWLSNHSRIGS